MIILFSWASLLRIRNIKNKKWDRLNDPIIIGHTNNINIYTSYLSIQSPSLSAYIVPLFPSFKIISNLNCWELFTYALLITAEG